jgi:hypothetical protein
MQYEDGTHTVLQVQQARHLFVCSFSSNSNSLIVIKLLATKSLPQDALHRTTVVDTYDILPPLHCNLHNYRLLCTTLVTCITSLSTFKTYFLCLFFCQYTRWYSCSGFGIRWTSSRVGSTLTYRLAPQLYHSFPAESCSHQYSTCFCQ